MSDTILSRSAPFEQRDGDESDGNTLFGYAAVFDKPTRIDSWEGVFDEDIARGAFKKSLSERTPVLQFDHGKHPMVGSIPLGYFRSLAENEIGLDVDAPLHDNWLVQPVRDAIKSKAIPGMSFRFSVVKDEWRTADGRLLKPEDVERALYASDRNDPATILRRTLREVKLYELGPVVFPAYSDTSVGVRSSELLDALKDPKVRAELAAALVSTPVEPRDAEGASGDEGAAPTAVEPPAGTPGTAIPDKEARERHIQLKNRGVIK